MKKYTLLFAFFLSLIYYSAFAQITTQGTDFYVSFGQNAGNAVSAVTMQIRIAATQDATVTFTFKADASTVTLNVQAGQVYTYNLDATQKTNVYSIAEGTSDKSLRIQSTAPVSVYALNQSSATTDATNVLPVNNLGMDYYQVSYQPLSTYADGYTVIATVNGTTVYENGSSKATLNAGQVYSAYYLSTDATGRHITSDHPIAYFATNSCVNVPVGTTYCDCLYQQMVPVNSWGNNFLVPVTHRGKERVRVVASQNNTTVAQTGGVKKTDGGGGAQNPANENSFTLNAGQFAEFEIALTTGGAYISADKPVAVASYLLGTGYSGLSDAIGDPALAWVPAVEQAADMAVIAPFAPSGGTNLAKHYALVVTPTATRDNTTIAIGSEAPAALSGGSWTTGNGSGSGMSFYSLQLTNTAASYYFNNLAGLTVMGYGTGSAESYYYLSGSAGRSLNPAFYINDVHYQDIDGNVFCGQTSFHIEGVAQFQVSSAPGHLKWYINGTEETSARDDFEWDKALTPGAYTFRMDVTDANNQTHSLTTSFTVKNQSVAATITTTGTSVCYNTTATLTGSSIAGLTAPVVYRWYDSQTATTPLYTGPSFTTPQLTVSKTYYVSVEGANYCENVVNTRKAVTVTVYGNLTAGAVGSAQSICYNTAPQALTESTAPGGGTGTYLYQWQSSANGSSWSDIAGAASATYSPGQLTANTYYRRAVTSGSCGTVYTASVLITILPVVTVNAVSNITGCNGTVIPATGFSSATSGATFKWTNSNTSIGLAASGTGNLPQFTAAQAGQATITVTPVYNGCDGTPRTFTITINPCSVPVNPHLRSMAG